jgi:hypothetical protein
MSDFKAIGKAFIDFYYSKFDTGPREGVAALYVNIFFCKKIISLYYIKIFLLF